MSAIRARAFATIHPIARTSRKTRIFGMEWKTVSARFWKLVLI